MCAIQLRASVAPTCASHLSLSEHVSQERALRWHQHQLGHLRGKTCRPAALDYFFGLYLFIVSSTHYSIPNRAHKVIKYVDFDPSLILQKSKPQQQQ